MLFNDLMTIGKAKKELEAGTAEPIHCTDCGKVVGAKWPKESIEFGWTHGTAACINTLREKLESLAIAANRHVMGNHDQNHELKTRLNDLGISFSDEGFFRLG